jgi:ATP-dependent exoDNAse (exonuclease V) alpha subunit
MHLRTSVSKLVPLCPDKAHPAQIDSVLCDLTNTGLSVPRKLRSVPSAFLDSFVQTEGATVLCTHRRDALKFNTAILQRLGDIQAVKQVYNCEPGGTWTQQRSALRVAAQRPGFHTLQRVAVGARVMLLKNIDQDSARVNGSTGVVTQARTATACMVQPCALSNPTPDHLQVNLTLNDIGIEMPASFDMRLDSDPDRTVRIYRTRRTTVVFGTDRQGFSATTFPATLCYAMTAHKVQGDTLHGRVYIHVRKAFAAGQLYVMLSRATTRSAYIILTELHPEDFVPIPMPDWMTENGNTFGA